MGRFCSMPCCPGEKEEFWALLAWPTCGACAICAYAAVTETPFNEGSPGDWSGGCCAFAKEGDEEEGKEDGRDWGDWREGSCSPIGENESDGDVITEPPRMLRS